jgi:hypothetical protein
MKSSLGLAFLCINLASLTTSCMSPRTAAMLTVPPPVHGEYWSGLTREDVLQITALTYGRSDIRKPIWQIYAIKPDEVQVVSGDGPMVTGFNAQRKNGRWFIIEKSVSTGRAIITG